MQDFALGVVNGLVAEAAQPHFAWALLAAVLAGLARGFSGFGIGLIFMPVASAALGPKVAVASLLVFDSFVMAGPLVMNAAKAEVRSLLPIAAGVLVMIPVGGWCAAHADPLVLRWVLSFVVLGALGILLAQWRWHGAASVQASVAAGMLSGFMGGLAALSGIVMAVFWLGRGLAPAIMRANMFALFSVTALATWATYYGNGMLTAHVLRIAALLILPYAASVFAGARIFHLAPPHVFRRVCYGFILFSAVSSLPLLDPLFGR